MMLPVGPRVLLPALIGAAALWLAFNRDALDPAAMERTLRSLGPWAPVMHTLVFALGAVLFVPGALFGLVGVQLFGARLSTLVNLAGETIGAAAAVLLARYLAQDCVRRMAGPRIERLIGGIDVEGWRFVALVRLVPLFPFSLTNYARAHQDRLRTICFGLNALHAARHVRIHVARPCRERSSRG